MKPKYFHVALALMVFMGMSVYAVVRSANEGERYATSLNGERHAITECSVRDGAGDFKPLRGNAVIYVDNSAYPDD